MGNTNQKPLATAFAISLDNFNRIPCEQGMSSTLTYARHRSRLKRMT
jgi:hypothetical protein